MQAGTVLMASHRGTLRHISAGHIAGGVAPFRWTTGEIVPGGSESATSERSMALLVGRVLGQASLAAPELHPFSAAIMLQQLRQAMIPFTPSALTDKSRRVEAEPDQADVDRFSWVPFVNYGSPW